METISIVRGNDFRLRIPIKRHVLQQNGSVVEQDFAIEDTVLKVFLEGCDCHAVELDWTEDEEHESSIICDVDGLIPLGTYHLIVAGKRNDGAKFRSKERRQLRIVDNNERANIWPSQYDGFEAYSLDTMIILDVRGRDGLSAYEIAVLNGFTGTETQWLKQLAIKKIEKTGTDYLTDTYTITYSNGATSTFQLQNGESAYQAAVRLGKFNGTEEEWAEYTRWPEVDDLVNHTLKDMGVSVDGDGSESPSAEMTYDKEGDPKLQLNLHHIKGDRGNGITSISQTVISDQDGGLNVVNIKTDDDQTGVNISIRNGRTGPEGRQGDSAVFREGETEPWSEVKNGLGTSTTEPMSQNAVTEAIKEVNDVILHPSDLESYVKVDGYILCKENANGRQTTSEEGGRYILVKNDNYSKVKVSMTNWTIYHLMIVFYDEYGSVALSNQISYVNSPYNTGTKYTYEADVPSGCGMIGFTLDGADSDNDITLVKSVAQYAVDANKEVKDAIDGQDEVISNLSTQVNTSLIMHVADNIIATNLSTNAGRIYKNAGVDTWLKPQSSGSKSNGYQMNVEALRGAHVRITPQDGAKIRVAITKNKYVYQELVQYAEGESVRETTEVVDVVIPNDANYLWWGVLLSSVDVRPALVEFYKQGTLEMVRTYAQEVSASVEEDKIEDRLKQGRYKSSSNPVVTLLHFSDIHGDAQAMANIKDFYDKHQNYITDILNTGDTMTAYYNSDDWDKIKNASLDSALFAVGNHDRRTTNGYKTVSAATAYATYFERVEDWEVTQPEGADENSLMYYYKDYATAGVRLIVLDGEAQTTAQLEWFVGVLADARENNLTVIVASHYIPGCYPSEYIIKDGERKTTFHAQLSETENTVNDTFQLGASYGQAVQDFIDAGGKFSIWLCGHYHYDMLTYAWGGWTRDMNHDSGGYYYNSSGQKVYKGESDVLFCAINKAGEHSADVTADRSDNKYRHCANLVTVQPSLNIIKIQRVGINSDNFLRAINVFVYDYVNKKLICNY